MHPGINNQRWEDYRSYPSIRGKERGHTHSEAMLSSLVHAFRQSSVKTLRRTPVCGSQRPNTTHLWSPYPPRFISTSSFLFISFIIAHPACIAFVLPPPSPLFLFPSFGLVCYITPHPTPPMARSIRQASSLRFPCSSVFLISSASLFVNDPDEHKPPFLWT